MSTGRHISPATKAIATDLLLAGEPFDSICARVGISPPALRKIRAKAGLPAVFTHYSPEEVAKVHEMAAAGLLPHQMLAQLPGRTLSSVGSRARALGYAFGKSPARTAALIERVRELAGQRMAASAIGREVGLSRKGVASLMRATGIPSQVATGGFEQRISEEQRVKALEMAASPIMMADIATAAGMTMRQLRRLYGKEGIKRRGVVPRPAKAAKAKETPAILTPPPGTPGIVNGHRLAGWHDILAYWRQHGGRGFPAIAEVNQLRRSQGRPPYQPMGGVRI